jgi:hypothetical protein
MVLSTIAAAPPPTEGPTSGPTAEPAPSSRPLLLGEAFPIEVSIAFHKAMLHWLDSLTELRGAGLTAGKTVEAHRREYERVLGVPSDLDRDMMKRYHQARTSFAQAAEPGRRDTLTLAFFAAEDLDAALRRSSEIMEPGAAESLAVAMRHFEPRYRTVWRDGRTPRGFLARARAYERRDEVASFLVRVARFFGVSPDAEPTPELIPIPVIPGRGTHAQAIGPYLLVEIRPGESLLDELAPIIHEAAHVLFFRIPRERLVAWEHRALDRKPSGPEAWDGLREALPTAIAQGIAELEFRREDWSMRRPWYHTPEIDRYAKRIFPIVREALDRGRVLDAELLVELIDAY